LAMVAIVHTLPAGNEEKAQFSGFDSPRG